MSAFEIKLTRAVIALHMFKEKLVTQRVRIQTIRRLEEATQRFICYTLKDATILIQRQSSHYGIDRQGANKQPEAQPYRDQLNCVKLRFRRHGRATKHYGQSEDCLIGELAIE